jgi:putative flippase GtrA
LISLLKKIILKNILIIKYIIVGGVNTSFGYAIYWAFLQLNFNFAIAAFFSTVLGTIFNFFTFGKLVFKSKIDTNIFYKFVFSYGFRYLLSIAGIAFFHSYGMSYEIAGAITIFLNAIIGFFLHKNIVFKK